MYVIIARMRCMHACGTKHYKLLNVVEVGCRRTTLLSDQTLSSAARTEALPLWYHSIHPCHACMYVGPRAHVCFLPLYLFMHHLIEPNKIYYQFVCQQNAHTTSLCDRLADLSSLTCVIKSIFISTRAHLLLAVCNVWFIISGMQTPTNPAAHPITC